MRYSFHPLFHESATVLDCQLTEKFQILLGLLATIAAIASAVAAWKASVTSQRQFAFHKKWTGSEDDLFLMRLTLKNLRRLKRIADNPLAVHDEDFLAIERIYSDIKTDLEHLFDKGALAPRESTFFDKPTFAKAIGDKAGIAAEAIEREIIRIQTKIDKIFS